MKNLEMENIETNKLAHLIAQELKSAFTTRWLKLNKAAAYSGISKKRLKQLAEDNKIVGFSDPDSDRGDWIFDKFSLDEYQANQDEHIRDKALALLRGK